MDDGKSSVVPHLRFWFTAEDEPPERTDEGKSSVVPHLRFWFTAEDEPPERTDEGKSSVVPYLRFWFMDHIIMASIFLSAEDEEQALSGLLSPVKKKEMTIEEHMAELESTFQSTMGLAHSNTKDPLRQAYGEIHSAVDADIIGSLRLAMEDIPAGTKGLEECKKYFSEKQHYTLLDVLVAQYVLNDGLLMRQHHDEEDEYHVDIAKPLVNEK